jgi:hypothetical protein
MCAPLCVPTCPALPCLQHGHVENDESWHPTVKAIYSKMDKWARLGRVLFPFPLFAYPFYVRGSAAAASRAALGWMVWCGVGVG